MRKPRRRKGKDKEGNKDTPASSLLKSFCSSDLLFFLEAILFKTFSKLLGPAGLVVSPLLVVSDSKLHASGVFQKLLTFRDSTLKQSRISFVYNT